jgi:predicted SAM-dependent methyltransferase
MFIPRAIGYIKRKQRRAFLIMQSFYHRNKFAVLYQSKKAKKEIEETIAKKRPLKIIVGSTKTSQQGWIATEQGFLDLLKKEDFSKLFGSYLITNILAEHVWEHLDKDEGYTALKNCFDQLAVGGNVRIAVPDGNHPDPLYIKSVDVGALKSKVGDHKVLYTYKTLNKLFTDIGFKTTLVEYFDESGVFHKLPYSEEYGHISRSSSNDSRNKNGVLNYTSIIIDGKK